MILVLGAESRNPSNTRNPNNAIHVNRVWGLVRWNRPGPPTVTACRSASRDFVLFGPARLGKERAGLSTTLFAVWILAGGELCGNRKENYGFDKPCQEAIMRPQPVVSQ